MVLFGMDWVDLGGFLMAKFRDAHGPARTKWNCEANINIGFIYQSYLSSMK
jgi:hypothetical protein